MEKEQFEGWAIVELFGHQVVAGYVAPAALGGAPFVRVDVPAVGTGEELPGFTRLYGGAAIYSLTPTDEGTAKLAAERLMARPVATFVLPQAPQLGTTPEWPDGSEDWSEEDEDEEEDEENWEETKDV